MSRYGDVESALSEFISNQIGDYDGFASYDHEHDHETCFEDKVDQYLADFRMGAHCQVQRHFEHAVSIVIEHYMENRFSDDSIIKAEVRIALRRIRDLGSN